MDDDILAEPAAGAQEKVPGSPHLMTVAKAIGDLDDLVRLLSRELSRAKPWQRQLAARLGDVDSLLQLLRLTVAMDRHDDEVLKLVDSLCVECSAVRLAINGSRADQTTKAAVQLITQLAAAARESLSAVQRSNA